MGERNLPRAGRTLIMVKEKKPARILIVDDEERNIEFLKTFLFSLGYRADGVIGGEKAIESVKKNPPDLVITEIMTDQIDGFEVTQRIRQEKSTRTLPIIIITAQKSKSGRLRAIEVGADEFITKPVDREEVAKRIQGLLDLNYYRSLMDEKKQLDAIVDGMSEGIIILEPSFRVTRFNNAARRLLGLKKSTGGSHSFLDHLYGNFRLSCKRDKLESGKKKPDQIRIVRPESEQFKALYISCIVTQLKDPAGNTSSIVMTLRDVTDRVREEQQKEAFLSSISHKLRTPATVLTGMLRLLKDETFGNLSGHQLTFLSRIHESADMITQLIEKLIAFNTLTRKELMMEGSFIALPEFMKSFGDRIIEHYGQKGVLWKIGGFDELPPCFFNPLQMEMIFWHLVDNAVKFNDSKNPLVRIQGRLDSRFKMEISVIDNGPGIPPENHDLVFAQFYQYERIYTGNVEGLGLGLSLVKKILEDWGQKITLESEIGKGCIFRFTLPTKEVT